MDCKAGRFCGAVPLWKVAETVGPETRLWDEEAASSGDSGALLPVPGGSWGNVVASRVERDERVVGNPKFGCSSRDGNAVGGVQLFENEVKESSLKNERARCPALASRIDVVEVGAADEVDVGGVGASSYVYSAADVSTRRRQ